ncbi:UDP-glucose 4-epimerase [Flavobacterium sp. 103]|uniref:NAD-dependent epimerase/dehydratase family protein n=1 Tax=Flavobacterium sp. 103 TaxID=2135624 RepID=UPI000D5F1092|nr:NAD(P)-dependent oxidoreductase [Flavobacterium sp. 103]PVX46585.1 UDP-glucose 4-epimerase [Flavobacterium sp. 103]
MKILITGIKGFLGSNLINFFKEKEYELYGLGTKEEVFNGIQIYKSEDLDSIKMIPDTIIMCHAAVASGIAILSNTILFDINVSLTERICEKFYDSSVIYISTASIYSDEVDVITENSNLKPQSNYSISKLWGEYTLKLNKKATIVRLSSLYGIGMKENTLIPNFINQAIINDIIEVWGDGSRLQNYVHVEDVAKLIKMIVIKQNSLFGEILLGVSQIEYSNFQIAKIISNITNSKIIFISEDKSRSLTYNNDYTTRLIGWRSKKKMEEKLNDYIKWKKREF